MIKEKKNMIILQLILILIGVLAILLLKTDLIQLIPPCTIKSHLGIICPTCGVTRCIINTLNLNFSMAFTYHPTFFIGMCYLMFIDVLYIVNILLDKKIFKFLYPSFKVLTIFYIAFFFQYFYRLVVMLKYGGFKFL